MRIGLYPQYLMSTTGGRSFDYLCRASVHNHSDVWRIAMGKFGVTEIVLVVLVVVLLFGGKKIPELMRGLGRGMKEFRDAKDGTDNKDDAK